MDRLIYFCLLVHALYTAVCLLESTRVTIHKTEFKTDPNIYELMCNWSVQQSASVILYRKNESQSSFHEIVDITKRKIGCQIIPLVLPTYIQCRCIDQGIAGCNITTTQDNIGEVEWKCAIPIDGALQFSSVAKIINTGKPTNRIDREPTLDVVNTRENQTVSLNCSYGISENNTRKGQKLKWYIMNGSNFEQHESVLNASFTRSDNGSIVNCDHDERTIAQWTMFVFYPATVNRFYVDNMQEALKVTLIERGNETIHCYGDGYPAPSLTLIRHSAEKGRNETLQNTVNSTHLRYDTSTLGSQHSGQYICVSLNRYGEDFRTLHLTIKQLQEIANLMQGSLGTQTETSVHLQWHLVNNELYPLVHNNTCYVLYKNIEDIEWNHVITYINWTWTLATLTLDIELTNLRPDSQYEAQLIASFSSRNYSIAPTVTFKTLSFSEATKLYIIVSSIVGSVLIISSMGVLLRLYLKRIVRVEAQGEIDNLRMNAPNNTTTNTSVGHGLGIILTQDEDHYDFIEMTRTQSCINPQEDRSGRFESVPPQIIVGTNLRDGMCLQTHTASKIAYDFLDRTGNPTEEQYNSMGEIVEGDMDEYITGCCHSSSSDTDSIISNSDLQYLTVIGNLPIPTPSNNGSGWREAVLDDQLFGVRL